MIHYSWWYTRRQWFHKSSASSISRCDPPPSINPPTVQKTVEGFLQASILTERSRTQTDPTDVTVVWQRQVPPIQTAEKTVQEQQKQDLDRVVNVPVTIQRKALTIPTAQDC